MVKNSKITSRKKFVKLEKGLKTPEKEFRIPILEALVELGGRAEAKEVLKIVEQKLKGKLNKYDYENIPSNPHKIRWKDTASWCRNTLVNEGLLSSNSPKGVWEITENGLAISEVRLAVEEIMDSLQVDKLDFLGMDACLMSSIEVAYELKDVSKYFLASAFTEPGDGWDYNFLKDISQSTGPEELGKTIIDKYFDFYSGTQQNLSLVLWDMSYMSNLASAISSLGDRLLYLLDEDLKNRILSYYYGITHYGDEGKSYYLLTDIGDFVYMLKTYESDLELVNRAQNVEDWLYNAVVYGKISGNVYLTSYGLSIYFPTTPDEWNNFINDINKLLFYTDGIVSGWGYFLYEFVQ